MPQKIPHPPPDGDPSGPPPQEAPPELKTEARIDEDGWLRKGWRWISAALARAEQRVTDNFQVPPHGG
jgi:hypothetical protein